MPHRLPTFIDAAVAFVAAVSALCAKIVTLAATHAAAEDVEDRLDILMATMLPLIGALAAALVCYLFSTRTNPEARAVIGGRAIVAGFGGVVIPRLLFMLNPHPGTSALFLDPIILMGMGFVAGWATYIMAYPFFASAQRRAPRIAEQQMDRINAAINQEKGNHDA
jgi:hypothetical protein